MTWYKCPYCGHVFEDFDVEVEHGGFYDPDEYHYRCPNCGAEEPGDGDWDAKECAGCGEFFYKDELEGGLCDDCREYVDGEMQKLLRGSYMWDELMDYIAEKDWSGYVD